MATYKGIKGFKTQSLATDPSPGIEGQVWYNTTTNLLKYNSYGTAWSSGGSLLSGRGYSAGCGTQTAAMQFGGVNPTLLPLSPMALTETYDGTSWTEVADLTTARQNLGGAGSTTAAIAFGGYTAVGVNNVELWNGSAWTATTVINTARAGVGPIGQVSTSVLAVSGGYNYPPQGITEEWNGSTWSQVGVLQTPRAISRGTAGTVSAGVAVAGDTNPPSVDRCSKATCRMDAAAVGAVQTAVVLFGGYSPPAPSTATEIYDGTCWTTNPNSLATARRAPGNNAGAASTAAMCIAGNPGYMTNVEEFGTGTITKTVTVS